VVAVYYGYIWASGFSSDASYISWRKATGLDMGWARRLRYQLNLVCHSARFFHQQSD
jgi:hypothetical protein